jgi:hypothetical protein
VNFSNPAPVYSGKTHQSRSLSILRGAELYLHTDNTIDIVNYSDIRYYLHGGLTGYQ